MNENNTKRAVTFEALEAAAPLIATKAEVKAVEEQVKAIETGSGITYATTEEVLALFAEKPDEGDEGDEGNGGTDEHENQE